MKQVFRLNQAIAKAGFCSRRQADEYIAAGKVKVNGQVERDFSLSINPETDILCVDGKELAIKPFTYLIIYKPAGIVTTCADEFGRKSILSLLPAKLRHLRPVGRLDLNSEGLIIMTNDGQFTHKLTHPSHHLPKKYLVTVKGHILSHDLAKLAAGVELSDGKTLPATVNLMKAVSNESTFAITIYQGRNRQIRRMCIHLGYMVLRLVRVQIGRLQLGDMEPGSWRYLSKSELKLLESM